MTSYIAITDTETDPEAPLTATLAKKWRDNPIAIAEGVTSTPYVQTGWHPYNGVTVGDGATGTIYDFAIDGSVASIETPNFVDGYEYMITFDGLAQSGSNRTIAWYRETSAAWSTSFAIQNETTDALIKVFAPRMVSNTLFFNMDFSDPFPTNGLVTQSSSPSSYSLAMTTAQKVLKARFQSGIGTFSGGSIRMFRRRCYA